MAKGESTHLPAENISTNCNFKKAKQRAILRKKQMESNVGIQICHTKGMRC